MRRFFFDSTAENGDIVNLPESESRHITRVLRLTQGEEVELLDGSGRIYSAVLLETGKLVKARVIGIVAEQEQAAGETRLIVGQGQLKGKKMDIVVQKCTELGVTRFMPFWSSRCQGKLSDLQGHAKLDRQVRIVEAACKQCFRSDLMAVDPPLEFRDVLSGFSGGPNCLRLLFWEEEKDVSLHDIEVTELVDEVVLLLGPEGGLTSAEVEEARDHGWLTVSLGKRILRAETATFTAVSIMQFLLKNI